MLVCLGDTHGQTDHRLAGRAHQAVREADHVVHTGDFTTRAVYEAFAEQSGADHGGAPLSAVHGNSDEPTLAERLPSTLVVDYEGVQLVVVHGHEHTATGLGLLARQEDADVVVVGHTHRPMIERTEHCLVVNPGSHADPRGTAPTHAEVTQGEHGAMIELRARDGSLEAEETIQT